MDLLIPFLCGCAAFITYRLKQEAFDHRSRAFRIYGLWPKCEHCGKIRGLRLEDSRTSYWYEGDSEKDDPNRSQLLCRRCAVLHHEYWDEMWRDYYSGRL